MTQEEAMKIMETMKPIIDPEIIFFAYFNDEPIGFFIMVPDLNRIIGKFNGKFGLIQKLRMLWDLKVRKASDRIFGIIFGIAPEFHGNTCARRATTTRPSSSHGWATSIR